MKLSLAKKYVFLSLSLVAILSITAGIAAGNILRSRHEPTSAASVNIEVVDNDQSVSLDQSTGVATIERTSVVTVRDNDAGFGYELKARLANSTMPDVVVSIGSQGNAICSVDDPCTLTDAAQIILSTTNSAATTTDGDTTTFAVVITIPAGVDVSDYVLDIEFSEEGRDTPETSHGVMQALTNENCPTLDMANPKAYTTYDARNNQTYYVAKIGGLCWMMSNLRYEGDGNYDPAWGWEDDRYATTASNSTTSDKDNVRPLTTVSGTQASSYTVAQIADPGGSTDYTNTTAAGGFYGYLYNWCAAMGGQTNACNNTSTSGFDTNISICPAGWRLPTGGSGGEFTTLNNTVNSSSKSSDAGLRTNFLAAYSGDYFGSLRAQGGAGYIWSSTIYYAESARSLNYYSSYVSPTDSGYKSGTLAVRCVR